MTARTYKAFAEVATTASTVEVCYQTDNEPKKRSGIILIPNLDRQGGGLNPPATKTEQRGGVPRECVAKSNIGIGRVKNRRKRP